MRVLLALVLLLGLALPASAVAARPNVVVIETDDQTVADLASMPETQRLIGAQGVDFTNSFVSLSQCCPSRATFLTGQYAHNHGVHTTEPPFGGFPAFHDSESLAVWLQRAGYDTGLVGKYFNGYGKDDPTYEPPGWTYWHGLLGPSTYEFTSFGANENGHVRRYRGVYKTDNVAARSEEFVRRTAAAGRPFFLWSTYVAPHVGNPRDLLLPLHYAATFPSPLFANTLLGTPMPRTPAVDEADLSDKPAGIRNRPHLGPFAFSVLDTLWRRRQQSLLSVDHAVQRMVDTLKQAGVLENTLLVFTSDNGFLLGEHGVRESKVLPYEPSIRVPLLMRGPGIPRGARRSQLVWNGDLAPTILEATGARAAWPADGMSLLPFARDKAAGSGRDILLEGPPVDHSQNTPKFTGLRTPHLVYVEYATREVELYDLGSDPYELHNLAGTPGAASLQRELAARLARLRRCAGASCRAG